MRATSLVKQMLGLRGVTVVEVLVRPHELLIKLRLTRSSLVCPKCSYVARFCYDTRTHVLAMATPRHGGSPDVAVVPTQGGSGVPTMESSPRQYPLPDLLGSLASRGTLSTSWLGQPPRCQYWTQWDHGYETAPSRMAHGRDNL